MDHANVEAPTRRTLLVIAGSGRSGTSLLAGLSARLGFAIPQPEIKANDTNPRGFGEPRWAIGFHKSLLSNLGVSHDDGRPEAWDLAREVLERPRARARLKTWLAEQFDNSDRVVVKDPRLAWFVPLYDEVAQELGADLCVATMLRAPAETIRSKEFNYQTRGAVTRTAGWLNMMLGVEAMTRDRHRAVIRYDDLLTQWRPTLAAAGDELGVPLVVATDEQLADADSLVDPSLRRMDRDWADLDVPSWLEDLAEQTYRALGAAAVSPDGTPPETSGARLDELRTAYATAYGDAEALVSSSLNAARKLARQQGRLGAQAESNEANQGAAAGDAARPPAQPTGAPSRAPQASEAPGPVRRILSGLKRRARRVRSGA